MKKYLANILIGVILLIGGFFVLINFNDSNIEEVTAGSSDNVYGWAWSDNIGWVSFNCENDYNANSTIGPDHIDELEDKCTGHDYGVNIDSLTGDLSGYAWSDNIGWISFNIGDTDCPEGSNCSPEVILKGSNAGEVSGWAFVCHASDLSNPNTCNPSIAPSNDYGWIKLRDLADGYAVDINTTNGHFGGYGWGGGPDDEAIIGPVSFNCKTGGPGGTDICATYNYYVWTDASLFNSPPEVNNLIFSKSDCCDQSINNYPVYFYFSWDYSDPDSDPQFSYELQVDYQTGDFSAPVITKYIETDSPNSTLLLKTIPIAGQDLAYNTSYKVRVIVWDNLGGSQGSSSVPSNVVFLNVPTDIPVNRYPKPDFSWDPSKPKIGDEIQFTNESIIYSIPPTGNYLWDFNGEGISTDTDPKFTFDTIGDKRVTLQVTDVVGNVCFDWRDIRIRLSDPDYDEVIPR